jgi:phage FluMu protein Com
MDTWCLAVGPTQVTTLAALLAYSVLTRNRILGKGDKPIQLGNQQYLYDRNKQKQPNCGTANFSSSQKHHPPSTFDTFARNLRCMRCNGLRSQAYHRRHYEDPTANPSVGICSRRRTLCAAAKARARFSRVLPMAHELPAVSMETTRNTHWL